jgi:hypothetical protein
MFPVVSHYDLLIVIALTMAIVITGFAIMAVVLYRTQLLVREARQGTEEIVRISKAIAGLIYQEEEKTRALLRQHGAP